MPTESLVLYWVNIDSSEARAVQGRVLKTLPLPKKEEKKTLLALSFKALNEQMVPTLYFYLK